MGNERMQGAMRDLQDAMAVMAQVEKMKSKQAPDLAQFQRRIERNLAEITDKLKRLLGYVAGPRPGEGPKR